jgi:phosphate:Na+ symporter
MTAILASLTTNVAGKRVAWAHLGFRLGGVLLILPFLQPFAAFVQSLGGDVARQVANAHTLVNIGTALIFLPFIPLALRVLRWIIPDRAEPDVYGPKSLDPRFHEQPSIAIASALREILRMGALVTSMLDDVRRALRQDDEELITRIRERDDKVDVLDEAITRYLTDLSTEVLSASQSGRVLDLLFVTKDLELIADIVSKGLVPGLLRKKHEQSLRFSEEGYRQILEFHAAVRESVELAVAAVATWDRDLAGQVLVKKGHLSRLERRFHLDHLRRLREKNTDSRATSTVHVDAINDLKRIVTHTARIAYAVLGKVHEFPKDDEIGSDSSDATGAPVGGGSDADLH